MNIEEAKKSLKILVETNMGSVAISPDFGIDWDIALDMPTETAKAIITAEIVEKQIKYIPEIEITSIECETTADGKIEPKIAFKLSDYFADEDEDDEGEDENEDEDGDDEEEIEEEYDE